MNSAGVLCGLGVPFEKQIGILWNFKWEFSVLFLKPQGEEIFFVLSEKKKIAKIVRPNTLRSYKSRAIEFVFYAVIPYKPRILFAEILFENVITL